MESTGSLAERNDARRDVLVGAGLALGSFLMLVYRYWFPPQKIFDEVYFARAAEE